MQWYTIMSALIARVCNTHSYSNFSSKEKHLLETTDSEPTCTATNQDSMHAAVQQVETDDSDTMHSYIYPFLMVVLFLFPRFHFMQAHCLNTSYHWVTSVT